MLGVEPLNLLHARARVLGEVEDVDLAVGENDPHAYGRVAQTVDAAICVGDRIVFQSRLFQDLVELPLDDARGRCSVGIGWQEQVVLALGLWVALADALISANGP